MLEDLLKKARLFDTYGALLTERQRRVTWLSLEADYSLSEIADELGITRQAVHYILRRSEDALAGYEARLGVLAREDAAREALGEIYDALKGLDTADEERRARLLSGLAPFAGREE